MAQSTKPPFVWVPGEGPAQAALDRLTRAFSKPKRPMGEAWFMGDERRMFPELAGDLATLPISDLQTALEQIATGPPAFGPSEEWTGWFHYLLPRIMPRVHETYVRSLFEILATAFMAQHPDGLNEGPYAGFRDDAVNTLGRCLMQPTCWPNGTIDTQACLDKYHLDSADRWFWEKPSGKLSASLFFGLKYLRPDEVGPWMRSVLAINSAPWLAQTMAWLVGAHGVLCGRVRQPAEFPEACTPDIGWEWSHCLTGNYTGDHSASGATCEFIPAQNRDRAVEAVRSFVTEAVFLAWLESISTDEDLEREVADIPFRFYELYGPGSS